MRCNPECNTTTDERGHQRLRSIGLCRAKHCRKGFATADKEITGVPCEVTGSGFSARVVTPAAVNVPVYGLRSKAIYVECTYNGQVKDVSLAAVNITENKALANGASGGLLGVIIVGAVVAGRKNKDQDEYGYNAANMIFKKGKPAE